MSNRPEPPADSPDSPPAATTPSPQPPSHRSKRRRQALIAGGVFLSVLIVAAIGIFFYIRSGRLNTYIGNEVVRALAEYGLRAEIGSFELAWGVRTARLHDVKIYNMQTNQKIATLDQIELVVEIKDLYSLRLKREVVFKRLDLNNLNIWLDTDAQGRNNLIGVHQPPPQAPSRITFDLNSLTSSINGGSISVTNEQQQLAANLGDLKLQASPIPGGNSIGLDLRAGSGHVKVAGRDTDISAMELGAQLGQNNLQIDRFILHSPLLEANATGRVDDFNAPRYQFDLQAKTNTRELTAITPELKLRGMSSFSGRIQGQAVQGQPANFQLTGSLNSDELIAGDARLQGLKLSGIEASPKDDRINFSVKETRAQVVRAKDVGVNNLAIGNLTGSAGKDQTIIASPQLAMSELVLSAGRLHNLKVTGLNAKIAGPKLEATAQQVSAGNLNVAQGQFNNITIGKLNAEVNGANYQATGDLAIGGGRLRQASLGQTRGAFVANNQVVSLNNFNAAVMGGNVNGDLALAVGGGTSKVTANFNKLSTAELFNAAAIKDSRVAGTIDGRVEISFPGLKAERLSGAVNLHLAGQTKLDDEGNVIPLTGDVAVKANNGLFNIEQVKLVSNDTTFTANGQFSPTGNSDLQFALVSTKAEQLQQIAKSLGLINPQIASLNPAINGNLNISGRVTGPLKNPSVDANLSLASLAMDDKEVGGLSGHLLLSPTEIKFENGLLNAPNGGVAKFNYAVPRAELSTGGRLDASFTKLDVESLAAGLPVGKFVSGELNGEVHLTNLPAAPQGRVMISLNNGRLMGQQADTVNVNLLLDGQVARLEKIDLALPQGHITAMGNLDLKSKDFLLQGRGEQIDLAKLAESFESPLNVTGTANADFKVTGNVNEFSKVTIDFDASGENVVINGRSAGLLRIAAHTDADGRVNAEIVTSLAGKPQSLKAVIELRKDGVPVEVATDLVDFDLTPLVATFAPKLVNTVSGTVTGQLRASGPLFDPFGEFSLDRLIGNLTLTAVNVQLGGTPINVETPLVVALNKSQIVIDRARFTGQGIDLSLGGKLGLSGKAGLNFAVNGAVDLNPLNTIDSNVTVNGVISVDAKLAGTFSKPQLSGEIRLRDISFSTLDSPVAIENGAGIIKLSSDKAVLENFTAKANNGLVQASGVVALAGFQPSDLKVTIMASDVEMLYQGAIATVNTSLTLSGNMQELELGGRVTIAQAEYTTSFDLGGLTSGGSGSLDFSSMGGSGMAGGGGLLPKIRLNIRVDAPNTIIVRNEQVRTVASAALNVGGSLNEPDISGRISLEGGTVKFRGQRYEITTGTLDLPGGVAGTPIVNLLAESDISGYHVYIAVTGPIDQLDLSLRAEPDLTRAEVISLITTGRTESGALTSDSLARTGLGTAASLISDEFISKPFGGAAESLLGLNRFQLDPVLRPNANPAARLTLGKQLARNLTLTYSTSLAAEQDQTAILEYNFSNRFSAIGSFTQGGSSTRGGSSDNDFSFEVRGRERFSLGSDKDRVATTDDNSKQTINALTSFAKPPLPKAEAIVEPNEQLKFSKDRLNELLPVRTQGYSLALARLGERNLINYMQEKGYFFADASIHCDPIDCSGPDLKLIYHVEPGQRYDLQAIRLEGTEQLTKRDVIDQLDSKEASSIGALPIIRNIPFLGGYARGLTSNDKLRHDREVIRRRLADLGFRAARVESRLAVSPDGTDLIIIFNVEEGARSTVEEVDVRGNNSITTPELRNVMAVKEGEEFSLTRSREAAQKIKNFYASQGYLETVIEPAIEDISENHLRLVYNVTEGARSIVQDIEITGDRRAHDDSVRRFFDFKIGDLLTPKKIQRTQRDLYATGNFREVNIRTASVNGSDDTSKRVIVSLTETKPLLLVYGLGYSTEDGPRGLVELTHTNLFNRLTTGSMRLRISQREQLAQITYTDLRPFNSKWPITISAFYNRNSNLRSFQPKQLRVDNSQPVNRDSFGLNRFAAFVQTEHKLSDTDSIRFRYNFENAKLFNLDNIPLIELTRNERATRIGSLSAGFTRDKRNSVINPTTGYLFSIEETLAARVFGGNESFSKLFTNYQYYQPLKLPVLPDPVFAFAARIGLASPFRVMSRNPDGIITESDRMLPISERFFGGGATTLRGFGFEEAGPQAILEPRNSNEAPTLVPIGGDALAVFNFEFRFPLTSRLQLVPFYDLGNVFPRVRNISFGAMTNTIGLGLRFNTPIGPVGVDYGYLLDPPSFITASGGILRPRRGVIHVRLGQSF